MRAVSSVFLAIALVFSIMVMVGLVVSPAVLAQDSTPVAGGDCPTTTPEENLSLVASFVAAWTDPEADISTMLLGAHDHSGNNAEPWAGAADWIAALNAQFPDLDVAMGETVADTDTVAAVIVWSGTLTGEDQRFGFPATGAHAEWDSVAFFQIECGKIASSWSVADNLARLVGLGAITDDEIRSAEPGATPTP